MIQLTEKEKSQLFWASFIALAAAGVGFVFRVMSITVWPEEFNITGAEAGSIFGASLWPIAVTMILFSLIVDKIGYKISMTVAFALQALSVILTFLVPSGENAVSLFWWASFFGGLGHGTIEAVINPLCATMYREQKSKMLNILHASWPAGIVAGGIAFILIDSPSAWKSIFLLMLIPIVAYGIIFLKQKKFPVDERVDAGVGYTDMLKEFGGLGIFLAITFLFYEISGHIDSIDLGSNKLIICLIIGAIGGTIAGFALKSKGKWLFFFLCLIMIPLATVELGTDAWIRSLMEPILGNTGSAWAIVASAGIMMVLRFFAGVPLKYTTAPGLLLISSFFSILGLLALSSASGFWVIIAFVLYAIGQTFYWPTILGFVAEQFPKGGAMTLNTVSAMGLLTIGIFGTPFLGAVKDSFDAQTVQKEQPALFEKYSEKKDFFGVEYNSIKSGEVLADNSLTKEATKELEDNIDNSARSTLKVAAILPLIMAIAFILMLIYYKSIGGYKPVILGEAKEEDK